MVAKNYSILQTINTTQKTWKYLSKNALNQVKFWQVWILFCVMTKTQRYISLKLTFTYKSPMDIELVLLKCRKITHFGTYTNFLFQSLLLYFPFFLPIDYFCQVSLLSAQVFLMLHWSFPLFTHYDTEQSDAEEGLYLTKFIFSGLHDSFQAKIKRRLNIVEYFLNHVSCLESKESPELKKCKSINQ